MTPEDRLREILHSHAETVQPAGDGLQRIQERIQQRRPSRWLVPAGGALVTAALASVLVLLVGGPGPREVVQDPASPVPTLSPSPSLSASPSPSPSALPGTTSPSPSPSPSVSPSPSASPRQGILSVEYTGPAIWPFRSTQEADAWRGSGTKPWADDPIETARHFVSDYLKLSGVTASIPSSFPAPADQRATVQLTADGRSVGRVQLAAYRPEGPWTVVTVGGTDLTITSPATNARITSPQRVTGRVTGVDESIRLDLITFSGLVIGTSFAPAGSEVPWEGELTWTAKGWTSGAIVGTTRSPRDGTTVTRIVAVPVLPG
jgi:hypothetical protein